MKLVVNALTNSPWVGHLNCGSCNGCDIEILALLTPRFDVERFGILLQGSPRHCDVLLCTGPGTRQMEPRIKRIYQQMAEPKFVVAIGTCACTGGVYQECYSTTGRLDNVVPVAAYIPGCPPRPEAIVDGVVKLIVAARQGAEPAPEE
ncbi:MAG: NADH-quinone oxidoreductase subunit B family protein [Candidatus Hodarchaeota archaeon]